MCQVLNLESLKFLLKFNSVVNSNEICSEIDSVAFFICGEIESMSSLRWIRVNRDLSVEAIR